MVRSAFLSLVLISACAQPPPIVVPECGAPQRLQFDVTQRSQRLTISNAFDAPRVMTIVAPPAPFSVEPVGNLRLEPHEVREVIVRYSPTVSADASWEFTPAAGCEPVAITLSGVTAEGDACLVASLSSVDFGTVEVACRSRDQLVAVTNTCAHSVRILEGVASRDFALIAGGAGELAPGQSTTFALSLGPHSEGPAAGALTLSADVSNGLQRLEIPLVGNATPMVVVEEVYSLRRYQRDVVIVLEDSPAMLPFSDTLKSSVNFFAHQLNPDEDIRVGLMTASTAAAELGRLRRAPSGAAWLENPSFTEVEEFVALTGSSTARSSCLEALQAAFAPGAELGLMLRPRARLEVICITSGADQLLSASTPLITSLLSSMPRYPIVSVVGHFSSTANCGAPLDSGGLRSFVERTGGIATEVCEQLWWLGEQSFDIGYRTNFFLERKPSFTRAPLEVSVDGVPIPEGPSSWTYLPENNGVSFEPVLTPRPGQTLRFRYSPDCP